MMLELILLFVLISGAFYHYIIWPHGYWRRKGVPQGKPPLLFGELLPYILRRQSTADIVWNAYNQCPGTRYSGLYQFLTPTLILKDPQLIKQIAVKDFDYFPDHRVYIPEEADPLWGKNLFALSGEKWREMRPILSPSFTSSKMKMMFHLISETAEHFVKCLLEKSSEKIEAISFFSRFANDVIASCAFGLKVDSISDENNHFFRMGKAMTDFTGFWKNFALYGYLIIPRLCKMLNIKVYTEKQRIYFHDLIHSTIKTRKEKGIVRYDLIHLLMEAKEGKKKLEKEDNHMDTGYATVQEETTETLRKYPINVEVDRLCSRPYTIPPAGPLEKPLLIEKGTVLWIPIVALHHDPKFFPEPKLFDPERFNEGNKSKIVPNSYLPFGIGPRNCIGSRFALLEIKLLMFHLLANFKVVSIKETVQNFNLSKRTFNMRPEGEQLWLGLEPIK
ncbi:cytochrome P450 9e2 isoform X2 [Leptinotarsa decemlineata]|uniref:cytochrome P450 9e2 isoform X2 n=1 Tax=Leptinotarsa decemlineata TaxID=7539 RepID=UPI003D308AC7